MARSRQIKRPALRLVTTPDERPVRVERGIWKYPGSGRYGVFIYRLGKQIFRMAESIQDAREIRAELERSAKRGIVLVARANQKIELGAFFRDVYVPQVMRGNGLKESTIRAACSRFKCHIEPLLGELRVAEITYQSCMALRAELVENDAISGQTRRECLMLLRQIMEEATLRGLAAANPAALVRLPKRNRSAVTVPELTDAKKIIAELRHPVARMLAEFLRQTGARLNEALALQWPCVDLAKHKVRIQQSIDQVTGRIVTTKTSAIRVVDLPSNLVSLLTAYRAAQEAAKVHRHDPWVFPAESDEPGGRPMNDRNFQQRHWDPAVERAGVPHCTPHSFRHLFASHLLQRGLEITYVSKLLGHGSVYTTANYYSHFLPGSSTARHQLDASFDE
ncbi:MAG TPA: tyrosine-type recombinase/integrase [Thermoanaerobaculia bacterium]|jgi:integrase